LLSAASVSTSIPASTTTALGAFSAPVPLGANWTIRLRSVLVNLYCADNSGQIQLQNAQCFWLLLNSAQSPIFTVATTNSWLSPAYTAPKLTGANIYTRGDLDQTVSSLDQIGSVVTFVQAQGNCTIQNLDAAAAHSVIVGMSAILEFESPGSGE